MKFLRNAIGWNSFALLQFFFLNNEYVIMFMNFRMMEGGICLKITLEEVNNLFRAVKIEGDSEEVERMSKEIFDFEKWVETMFSIDTKEVEPTFYNFKGSNVQRVDESLPCSYREKLFKAALNYEDGFYLVPPIIE